MRRQDQDHVYQSHNRQISTSSGALQQYQTHVIAVQANNKAYQYRAALAVNFGRGTEKARLD
jgi:hypothetical protein